MKRRTNLSSRREFLATTSAVATSGSALAGSKKSVSPFRIDVQSHMYPPPVLDFMMTRDTVPRAYKNEGGRYPIESRIIPRQSKQREDCFQKAVIKRGLRLMRRSALRARSLSSP